MKKLLCLNVLLLVALACSCGDDSNDDPINAATVTVTLEGQSQDVDLGQVPRLTIADAPYASLAEVIAAAFPAEELASLQADFLDSTQVSPSTKDYCKDLIPAAGEYLAQGYIQLESRRLSWDETLQYPACMSWRDVAVIALSHR